MVSGVATAVASLLGIPLGVALHVGRFRGRVPGVVLVNAGMALPPVVVGLLVTLVLWRTGPLGALRLLFTPQAMILAQVLVATPLVAGFTRRRSALLDADLALAMRADGAGELRIGRELARAALPQVLVAVAAGFGRAISEGRRELDGGRQYRRPDAHPDDSHCVGVEPRRLRPGAGARVHSAAAGVGGERDAGHRDRNAAAVAQRVKWLRRGKSKSRWRALFVFEDEWFFLKRSRLCVDAESLLNGDGAFAAACGRAARWRAVGLRR